jgi:hypothetical protein
VCSSTYYTITSRTKAKGTTATPSLRGVVVVTPAPEKKGVQKETRNEKGERHRDHPTGREGGRGDPSPGNMKARPSRNKMGDTLHELFCHNATTPSGESNWQEPASSP